MPLIDFLKEYAEAIEDLKKEHQAMADRQKAMQRGAHKNSRGRR